MDPNEELDDRINRYVQHKMDPGELSQFEAVLASDPVLKKELAQMQQLKSYYNHDLVDFKRSLQEAERRYREKNTVDAKSIKSGFKKRIGRWMAIAACIIVIASIFYLTRSNTDVAQLAKENSLDGLNKSTVRKGDSIAVADVLFYSGNYHGYINKALTLLKENTDPVERSILHINICKSYIQLSQADRAILFYQSLTEEEKKYCYLQYQAALAYTITGNKKEAIPLFESVSDKGCFPVDKNAVEWIKRLK